MIGEAVWDLQATKHNEFGKICLKIQVSGVGTFFYFVWTSKLVADQFVCPFRIYHPPKNF